MPSHHHSARSAQAGRPLRRLAVAVLAAVGAVTSPGILLACSGASERRATPSSGDGLATVVRVVDGDTLVVRFANATTQQRVRLLGMDTPESVKPNTPVQCFAKEASKRTEELVPPGTALRLVGDVESHDAYGRLLAYVYRQSDDLFLNLTLVQEGFAQAYTFPPNVSHAEDFVRAAADARQAGRGLWANCPNVRPKGAG